MAIPPDELRIDTIRTVGGGCAVRITHIPTGISLRSGAAETAGENRALALRELEQRLSDG